MDNEQYLNEIQKALENDTQTLGKVWRLTNEGKSATEIAEKLNVSASTFVYGYQNFIQAIEERDLPKSPSVARGCGAALRGFINRGHKYLSEETNQELRRRAEECDRIATDLQALEEEDAKVEKQTSQAEESFEKSGIAGIYVYTYPHYYRHPVMREKDDEVDDRTYLKIGMSKKDASERVMQQTTGMPEQPMLLQIWVGGNDSDLKKIEKKIHDHLRTVGHGNHQNSRPGSKEWFLTNEQSVASTANLLRLKLHFELNLEMDD